MKILELKTGIIDVIKDAHGTSVHVKPNTTYAMTLTEMPKGYRLATDEDKKNKIVWYSRSEISKDMNRFPNGIGIVPIESEADRKRKEIENEIKEAQTKLDSAQKKLKKLS